MFYVSVLYKVITESKKTHLNGNYKHTLKFYLSVNIYDYIDIPVSIIYIMNFLAY